MTIVMPEGVPTLANTAVKWVASIADPTAPTLAELTAAAPASFDLSCALYADSFQPTQDVSRSNAPRRLCSRTSLSRITDTTRSLPDITYAIEPQAAAASDGKRPFEILTEGTSGFLVARFGLDARNEAWAAGQFVSVFPVTLGAGLVMNPQDDGAEYMVSQPLDIRADIEQLVEIAAA